MANQPADKRKNIKPRTLAGFFRQRRIIVVLIVVLVVASVFFVFKSWLDSRNERESTEAAQQLESGNYKTAYSQLKQVDARGGTPKKNSEQEGHKYYLALARAAYLAGDNEAAKQYAKEGIKRLPSESSGLESMDGIYLQDLADGTYVDTYEYQSDKPSAGEGR